MAKAAKKQVQRKAQQVAGKHQAKGSQTPAGFKARTLTVGELIAAAFDTLGNEVKDVARVLASPDLACAIQKRIVLVQ